MQASPDAPRPDEDLCRRVVETARDAIVVADRDGVIRLWNPGAEAIFGHPAAEALGRSLDLIIPERQRERHWDGWRRALATGTTRYDRDVLAVPALRKDGARISVEFTIAFVRDDAGAIAGVAAILRDVTRRWLEEKTRRERAAGHAP